MTIDIRKYVQEPNNRETIVFQNGDTGDIMTVIQRMDRYCAKSRHMRKLAALLRGSDDVSTCKRVWKFATTNFQYKADINHEKVKASNWLVFYRVGDCKSYSVAIIDILRELGYSCFYRFVSFSKTDSTPTHVFPVCRAKNGSLIFLDAVPFSGTSDFRFNQESDYTFYKDIDAASIRAGVSGLKHSY